MRTCIDVLSVPVDCITMTDAIARIEQLWQTPGLHLVATANAEMVMLARSNKVLHKILNEASMVLPDGAGVLWAAEQQGKHLPERVTGVDITKHLFKLAAEKQVPIYCLGAAPGVAQQAVDNMEKEVGPLRIVGIHDGFFSEEEEQQIIKHIEEGGAKLVFVALGVPKQEEWISTRLCHLNGVVAIGIGGSFDVLAGHIRRAPQWMQKNRLEWLYRLYLQPKRIGRMMAIPKFMWTVMSNRHKEV